MYSNKFYVKYKLAVQGELMITGEFGSDFSSEIICNIHYLIESIHSQNCVALILTRKSGTLVEE
jgi:hypothetical protein